MTTTVASQMESSFPHEVQTLFPNFRHSIDDGTFLRSVIVVGFVVGFVTTLTFLFCEPQTHEFLSLTHLLFVCFWFLGF